MDENFCDICNIEIEDDCELCDACREEVEAEERSADLIICILCGEDKPEDQMYCRECHESLKMTEGIEEAEYDHEARLDQRDEETREAA